MCHQLLARAPRDAAWEIASAWRNVEAELLEHMAAEEHAILPSYAEHAPADAQRIADDHARIRELLVQIGAATAAPEACCTHLRELVAVLDVHADHEDSHMYPWAQRHLPQLVQRSLFARFVALWFHRR